jgi:hypothetical protein
MSFNFVSTLLCVSSDTETVHIFKLSDIQQQQEEEEKERTTVDHHQERRHSTLNRFLPERLTDIWESSRHFASLKLPNAGVHNLVALSRYIYTYIHCICFIIKYYIVVLHLKYLLLLLKVIFINIILIWKMVVNVFY